MKTVGLKTKFSSVNTIFIEKPVVFSFLFFFLISAYVSGYEQSLSFWFTLASSARKWYLINCIVVVHIIFLTDSQHQPKKNVFLLILIPQKIYTYLGICGLQMVRYLISTLIFIYVEKFTGKTYIEIISIWFGGFIRFKVINRSYGSRLFYDFVCVGFIV